MHRRGVVLAVFLAGAASAAAAELNRWTSLGPQIDGGTVHAIRVHPLQSGTLYAGTDSGVFVSQDSGQTWAASNAGLSTLAVLALAIDPIAPSNLYAGTSGGIFKSADAGATWLRAGFETPPLQIRALAIDPRAPWIVSAATDAGVLQTTDAGSTWLFRNDSLTDLSVSALAVAATTPTTLIAGTRSGRVFRTNDASFGWAPFGNAPSPDPVLAIAISPGSPDTVLVGTLGSGVFRNPTADANWTRSNTGLGSLSVDALVFLPAIPARLLAATSGGGIYESNDNAATWAPVNSGLPAGSFVFDLAPAGNTVFAATAAGLVRSTTGGSSWEPLPGRFLAASITALAFDALATPQALHAGAASGDVLTRPGTSGTAWTIGAGFSGSAVQALIADPSAAGVLYYGTSAGFFVSVDGGASWTPRNGGLQNQNVHALAWSPPATLYAGTDTGVFKTLDGGRLWTSANAGIASFIVTAVAVDPRAAETVYAAGTSGVAVSRDGGATWSSINQGLNNTNILAFAIDPSVSTTLYAAAFSTATFGGGIPGGVFKSTDGGASWTSMTAPAQIPSDLQALTIDPASPSSVYVGTQSSGVFVSRDGGQTWSALSDGLASFDVFTLAFGPGARLWAGTTKGVFELTSGGPLPCSAGATTLCLLGNRFRVEVFRSAVAGFPPGPGRAIVRTSDTGGFWFFSNDNTELLVKVLDGRFFNSHYWVFFASLTDVAFDLTVTDTLTGQSKTYRNAQGNLASVADTSAFAGGAAQAAAADSGRRPPDPAPAATPVAGGPCSVTAEALCLNGFRFRVQVSWQAPTGAGGAGQLVPMSPNSGGFWFFSPDNIELVVKVLDGRSINGRFWVFFGALSNVAYTITVTDTQTGLVRSYVNPQGQLASVADTTAF